MQITKRLVDGAQPGGRVICLWDKRLPGFGVKVTPKGKKVFIYQYRMGGRGAKSKRFTIGQYGPLTVDQARRKAEGLALQVANGVDPQAAKKKVQSQARELAFKAYVERFRAECLEKEWVRHKYNHSLLVKHAVPVLGDTPLPDITRRSVKAVLAPVANKAATASNVFIVLRRLFNWAVEQEDLERSPLEGMKPPVLPKARERVLNDEELGLVWRAAETIGYPFGPIVHLLILTGARRDEVAALDWSELDRDDALWTLPACRSKNDRVAVNPLSPPAVALLDELAKRSGLEDRWPREGLVFSTTGKTPVSGFSRAKNRLDRSVEALAKQQGLPIPPSWCLHDLRRTLATGLQRLGVRLEVTESVLNHVSGSRSGIVGIYQRHEWKDEKRAALGAWANHLDRVLNGADSTNVVPLAEARS